MNGYKQKAQTKPRGSLFLEPNFIELPKKIDYRDLGYVTPVKDQVRPADTHFYTAMFYCLSLCPYHTERAC